MNYRGNRFDPPPQSSSAGYWVNNGNYNNYQQQQQQPYYPPLPIGAPVAGLSSYSTHYQTDEKKKDKYRKLGDYETLAWSIAGQETSVLIRSARWSIPPLLFDLGISLNEGVQAEFVFITHGHIDHFAALPLHARKRQLNRLPPASYFVPESIAKDVELMLEVISRIHGEKLDVLGSNDQKSCIIPVVAGQRIVVNGNIHVLVISTHHRVDSVGFIVYRRQKKFTNPPTEDVWIPSIAYLGDTQFSIFQNPETPPDLLLVELLITEATYIDKPNRLVERADERGHSHLEQFKIHSHLFGNVKQLLLIHLSSRYGPSAAINEARNILPDWLFKKTFISTYAKSHGI